MWDIRHCRTDQNDFCEERIRKTPGRTSVQIMNMVERIKQFSGSTKCSWQERR